MKLEQQVCSLDLAKRLKELGVKQESYFVWIRIITNSSALDHVGVHSRFYLDDKDITFDDSWGAFTVAELGEMLPKTSIPRKYDVASGVGYRWENELPKGAWFSSINEADARAKMLVYLLENKLIEI